MTSLRRQLETGAVSPADALAQLIDLLAAGAPRAKRADAYRLVGDIAGRAFDAPWETAERAAWVLLGAALGIDTPGERRELLLAMGRGFRNLWLLPFVHARLDDEDPDTAEAAIAAAGGLGFPGLEAVLASFLDEETPPALRLAAVRNAVTHRTAPPPAAVEAFRRSYYGGFEELCGLA